MADVPKLETLERARQREMERKSLPLFLCLSPSHVNNVDTILPVHFFFGFLKRKRDHKT